MDNMYQSADKRYAALPQTPSEFTSGGFMLNPASFEDIGLKYVDDPGSLIPGGEKWGNVVGTKATLNDNGKAPNALSITVSNNKISWGLHPEGDVVGYRVYKNGRKVASINSGGNLVYTAGSSGSYYVTAVDIVGKESAPSQHVEIGAKKTSAKAEAKDKDNKSKDSTKNKDNIANEKTDTEEKKPDSKEENVTAEKDKDTNNTDKEDTGKDTNIDKETDQNKDQNIDQNKDTDKAEEEEEE